MCVRVPSCGGTQGDHRPTHWQALTVIFVQNPYESGFKLMFKTIGRTIFISQPLNKPQSPFCSYPMTIIRNSLCFKSYSHKKIVYSYKSVKSRFIALYKVGKPSALFVCVKWYRQKHRDNKNIAMIWMLNKFINFNLFNSNKLNIELAQ